MAKLHQLNVRFDAFEDRLVLSISTDDGNEVRIFLTRRYTKLLLAVLEKLSDQGNCSPTQSNAAKGAIKAFKRDEALSKADFATNYQQAGKQQPLGETPLLVSKIKYTIHQSGGSVISMSTPEGSNINLNLTQELAFSLIKLINTGVTNAEWMLGKTSIEEIQAKQSASSATAVH
ncbi:hypothetical protein MNBD_GAMMA26-650 [hydrothermal vent metagenome]|uniref:Uncharacterized protein n=1 Tax=hydrothermal vent metagenome TaxID=652676 RepID=A0A3B1BMT9_9ZZZZ